MRSSETRARNGLADSGRRNSKALKLRVALPPPHPTGEVPPASQPSPLYSQQLWAASGHLQQRLTCDRHLYYPELTVSAPVQKQLPDETVCDVQQGKRAKLAGGQYRRSFREAGSDSTPPGTPYKPSIRNNHNQQQQLALEERANSTAYASTSSSSSHEFSQPHRQSACSVWDGDIVWPLVVLNKRRRSSRRRRDQWQHLPLVLQGIDVVVSSADSADSAAEDASSGDAVVAVHAAQTGTAQEQLPACSALLAAPYQHLMASQTLLQQQQVLVMDVQQQDQQQQQQQAAVASALQPTPPVISCIKQNSAMAGAAGTAAQAESAMCGTVLVLAQGKAAIGAADISPGQETSQSSDMTCMQESPHAVAVHLSSWPSSSTDSDCQAQPHDCVGVHNGSMAAVKGLVAAAVAAAAGKQPLVSSVSADSPSSPLHEVF